MNMATTVPSLAYDRGTVIIQDPNQSIVNHLQSFVRWDERTSVWRAPASAYHMIIKHLRMTADPWKDNVRRPQTSTGTWSTVDLRDYQEAALIAWRASGGRGVVCLPTGAGKTRLAMAAAQRSNKSTLCLVPTLVLLEQWQASIRKFYDGEIGIVGGGSHKVKPITVATYESAYRKGWQFGDQFDLIVIDEAHHFGDGERDEALEVCMAPFRLGLSATLDESKMERRTELIGPKVYEQNVRDLVGTALAEFDLYRILLPLTPTESRAYHLDFDVFQKFFFDVSKLESDMSWESFVRIAGRSPEGRAAVAAHRRAKQVLTLTANKDLALCQLLEKYQSHRKLIFTADSQTALLISKRHLIAPITSEIGKKERDSIIDSFRIGAIRSLVSCKVLNEGFDVPDADIAIIVGGSGSDREHIQRIGRVLRPSDGKRAKIYELLAAGTSEVKQSHRRGAKLNEPARA